MARMPIIVSIVSVLYTALYFYWSIGDYESYKFIGNIIFTLTALILLLRSRVKPICDSEEDERTWNFALATCALVISIIDPISKFSNSAYGEKLIVKIHMPGAAFLSCTLAIIVLLAVIAIGIKYHKK
ncbi:hypothetical protein [Tatumella saanichensis]|uniref:hypothetical protein n=1 Tax=Tatumella saanichensis TaxID=480813 RepID=UPI0004A278D1|nr:hypothetical protein [Tatumella saanichensis]